MANNSTHNILYNHWHRRRGCAKILFIGIFCHEILTGKSYSKHAGASKTAERGRM
jgi:hypothetical protein